MKKKFLVLACLVFLLPLLGVAENNEKLFKLAVFDNIENDISTQGAPAGQETAYMQGIKTAVAVAKEHSINIEIKDFFYESGLLDFMQQMPKVKEWDADTVIGLHSSSSFLMSKSHFTDKLVLSIEASSPELAKLPTNFYSLATPDVDSTKELVNFLIKKYPNRNLLNIVGTESKQAMEFADLVTSIYKKRNPKIAIKESRFLSDDVNVIDIGSLVKKYKSGDIIILYSMSGTYGAQIQLMNKIANYLAPNKLTFIISFDNWNAHTLPANTNDTKNPYTAFRFDALYFDTTNSEYHKFVNNFEKIYHQKPTSYISYLTYRAVMSIPDAIEKYPAPENLSTRQAILWSYQQALKHNPNWFRPKSTAFYKLENNKEVFFDKLSIN